MATRKNQVKDFYTDDDILSFRQKSDSGIRPFSEVAKEHAQEKRSYKNILTDDDISNYRSQSKQQAKPQAQTTQQPKEEKPESGLKKFGKDLWQFGIKEPAMETARGLYQGTASVYDDLARSVDFINEKAASSGFTDWWEKHGEPLTGIKSRRPGEGGTFHDLRDMTMQGANAIPHTATGDTIAGKIYQGMGAAPPVVAEYALPSKFLKSGKAGFALTEAFKHVGEDPKEIAGHAAKGYLMGGVLEGANYLPILARMPAVGGLFASDVAMQKGSTEDIIASFFVGAGLAAPGRIGSKADYTRPFEQMQYKIKQKQTMDHLKKQAEAVKEVFNLMSVDPSVSRIQLQKLRDFVMRPENLGRTSPEGVAAARAKALQKLQDYQNKKAHTTEGYAQDPNVRPQSRPRTPQEKSIIREMQEAIKNDKTATPKEIAEATKILDQFRAAEEAIIADPRPTLQEAQEIVLQIESKGHDQRDPETGEVVQVAEILNADEIEQVEMAKHSILTGDVKPPVGDVIVQAQEAVDTSIKNNVKNARKAKTRGPVKSPRTLIGEVRRRGGVSFKSIQAAGYNWQDIKEFGLMSIINNKSGQSFDSLADEMFNNREFIADPTKESVSDSFMRHLKEKATMLYDKTAKELDREYQEQYEQWIEQQGTNFPEGELLEKTSGLAELDRIAKKEAQSEFIQETGGEDASFDPVELNKEIRAEEEYNRIVKDAESKRRRKELMESAAPKERPIHEMTLREFQDDPRAINVPKTKETEVLHKPIEKWKFEELHQLSGKDLEILSIGLGISRSGTKVVKANRISDAIELRKVLKDATVESLTEKYKVKDLKFYLKSVKAGYGGSTKAAMAKALIDWRNRSRKKGKEAIATANHHSHLTKALKEGKDVPREALEGHVDLKLPPKHKDFEKETGVAMQLETGVIEGVKLPTHEQYMDLGVADPVRKAVDDKKHELQMRINEYRISGSMGHKTPEHKRDLAKLNALDIVTGKDRFMHENYPPAQVGDPKVQLRVRWSGNEAEPAILVKSGKSNQWATYKYMSGPQTGKTVHVKKSDTGEYGKFELRSTELLALPSPNMKFKRSVNIDKIDAKALKEFGDTYDFNEAGYMLRDGTLLDFSEKRDGGSPGMRSQDHRAIENILPKSIAEKPEAYGARSKNMRKFMQLGNIRLQPESGGFDIEAMPTSMQQRKLAEYINERQGEIIVDMNNGEQSNSREYDIGTSAYEILNDVKDFYMEDPHYKMIVDQGGSEIRPFYSHLRKTIVDKMPAKSSAEQLRNILEKSGISKDELEWFEPDALFEGKETVTKTEALEHFEQHNIQIEESWRTEKALMTPEALTLSDKRKVVSSKRVDLHDGLLKAENEITKKLTIKDEQKIRNRLKTGMKADDLNYTIVGVSAKSGNELEIEVMGKLKEYDAASKASHDAYKELRPLLIEAGDLGFDSTLDAATALRDHTDYAKRWDLDGKLLEAAKKYHDAFETYDMMRGPQRERFAVKESEADALISYPGKTISEAFSKIREKKNEADLVDKEYREIDSKLGKMANELPKHTEHTQPGGSDQFELLLKLDGPHRYSPPDAHFSDSNLVVHVRGNTRTSTTGDKILYLEEMQSDWHQAGREQGYAHKDTVKKIEELQTTYDKLSAERDALIKKYNDHGNLIAARTKMSKAERIKENAISDGIVRAKKAIDDHKSRPADAPFKKSWHELAFKRMIRYAAEHGYDRIAWTPGEVQAQRWNQIRELDDIRITTSNQRRGWGIDAYAPDGTFEISNWIETRSQLEAEIGPEAAAVIAPFEYKSQKEILDMGVEGIASPEEGVIQYIPPTTIKFGGEGMKGFYDKMIPSFAKKYVKKWGSTVEPTEFRIASGEGGSRGWEILDPSRRTAGDFGSEADARRTMNELINKSNDGDYVLRKTLQQTLSIPITEAMRTSVMTESQKFRIGFPNTGRRTMRATLEARRLIDELLPEAGIVHLDRIETGDGGEALGMYYNDKIYLQIGQGADVAAHEIVHGYLDKFVPPARKKEILQEIKDEWGATNDLEAEEMAADGLWEYIEKKKNGKDPDVVLGKRLTSKIRQLFERIWNAIKRLFDKDHGSAVKDLYEDILNKRRPGKKSYQDLAAEAKFKKKPEGKKSVKDLMADLKKAETGKNKPRNFKDLVQEAYYKSSPDPLKRHIDYVTSMQLPQGSKIEGIKQQIAVLNGKRLSGKLKPHKANHEIFKLKKKLLKTGHFEGVAIRKTKGGKYYLSVRKSGVFVPKDFQEWPHFKDAGVIMGGGTDTINMLQNIDGARSAKQLKDLPDQSGPVWKYIGRRYQDISKDKLDWIDVKTAESQAFLKTKEGTPQAKLLSLLIEGKSVKDIRSLYKDKKTADKMAKLVTPELQKEANQIHDFLNRLLTEQNQLREMRNQPEIKYRKDYITHTMRDITIWERMGFKSRNPDTFLKSGQPLPDFVHPDKPFNPRELAREGDMAYDIRELDAIKLYRRYVATAARDIFDTSIVQNNKAFADQLDSMGYRKSAATIRRWTSEAFAGVSPGLMRELNLGAAGKGVQKKVEGVARRFNQARNLAVFGFNYKWAMITQTSSFTVLTTARNGMNAVWGLMDWMKPSNRQMVRDLMYSYKIKTHGSGKIRSQDAVNLIGRQIELERTPVQKFNDMAMWHVNTLESMLTGASIMAGLRTGAAKGLRGRALLDYASNEGAKTQSMYNDEDRGGVLRPLLVKTMTPYQTFTFQFVNTIKEWAGKTGMPPDTHIQRAKQLMQFMLGIWIANAIAEKVGKDKLFKWNSIPVPFSNLWLAPIMGGFDEGKSQWMNQRYFLSPVSAGTGIAQALGEWSNKGDVQPLRRELLKWIPGWFGIPGGVQYNRIADTMVAFLNHGYQEPDGTKYGRHGKYKIKYEDVPVEQFNDGSVLIKTRYKRYRVRFRNWDHLKEVEPSYYHEAVTTGRIKEFAYPQFSEKFRFREDELMSAIFGGPYNTLGGQEYIKDMKNSDKPKKSHLRRTFKDLIT